MKNRAQILLIEDSPDQVRLAARLLSKNGYDVLSATTGESGLRLAREQRPDLILLDVVLPDVGGFEVCQRIKADPELEGAFVVLLSSLRTTSENRTAGLRAGADDYIVRPLPNQEFLARVRAWVRIIQAEDALRLSHRFLQIANRHAAMAPLLNAFIAEVKLLTDCAAVGIRLLDGEGNIPYEAYDGFEPSFYESESPLSIESDACMCIDVIEGNTDPDLSFFTEAGSFYMNATSRFLATVSEEEKGATRNVCNQYGYESVALVPIWLEDRILGLIHVADPREDQIPRPVIETLEKIAMQLGTAIQRVSLEESVREHRDHLEKAVERRTAELRQSNQQLRQEIAQRRRAEEALRESESRFRRLFEQTPLAYQSLDAQGRILEVNPAWLETLGYRRDEVIGRPFRDFLADGQAESFDECFSHFKEAGEVHGVELVTMHRDGSHLTLAFDGKISYDQESHLQQTHCILTNVTERQRREEALRRRTEELEALRQMSLELGAQLDLDKLLHSIAGRAVELLGGTDGGLYLHNPERDVLEWAVAVGENPAPIGTVLRRGEGLAGKVWARGKAIAVKDYRAWDGRAAIFEGYPFTSAVDVPIRWGDEFLGVLNVNGHPEQTFSADDVKLLNSFASQASIALRNARIYEQAQQEIAERKRTEEELERRMQQIEALRQIGLELAAQLDLETLLHAIVTRAVELLWAQAGEFYVYHPERDVLERSVALGTGLAPLGTVVQCGEGLAGQVWETGQPVVVRNYAKWEGKADVLDDFPFAAVVGVPVQWGVEFLGVLSILAEAPRTFSSKDVELLTLFAAQAAAAIANTWLFEDLHASEARLRHLTRQVISAQEEERRRLSRELHDEAGQALTALKLGLELLLADLPPDAQKARRRIADAVKLSDRTMEQIRLLAHDLRPPALDAVGLNATLEGFCREFANRTGLTISYRGMELPDLADEVSICLYRCLQEALTNVAKHAQATWVRVTLSRDAECVGLTVADNGQGFDTQAVLETPAQTPGMGLLGAQERLELLHGRLHITSRPGLGTRLRAQIPTKEEL